MKLACFKSRWQSSSKIVQPLLHTLASTRMGKWRRSGEHNAGWFLSTKKILSKTRIVGDLKRSTFFYNKI